MDNFNSVVPGASDFSLLTLEEKEKKSDPFSSDHRTWSKRYHCLQAYICIFMTFTSTLEFGESLARYGSSQREPFNSMNSTSSWHYKCEVSFYNNVSLVIMIIPYCLGNVIIGMPAVLVEIMLGRYVLGNVTRAWSMCLPAKGVFFCLIGTTIISICHGNMCNLYLLRYFFLCFGGTLPWDTCNKSWAKINCYEIGKKPKAILKCQETHSKEFCGNLTWETSGMQYWNYVVKNTADVGNVINSITCLFLSVCIVVIINYRGIQTMEKMLTLMTICPIALGVFLTFPCLSLPGAWFGIKRMFSFEWHILIQKQIWIDTFEDIFTLLGLGRLSLSFVSSHGKFTDDIIVDVVVTTCGSFVLCVFMIFPFLSIMLSTKLMEDNGHLDSLIFKDTEDVFITMSEALYQIGFPQNFWSLLTYLHWFMMSINAQVILVLAASEAFAGIFHKLDKFHYFIGLMAIFSFLSGCVLIFLPFNFIWILNTPIITIVFLSTITWQLFYGIKRFNNDYYFMMGYPLPFFLKFTWFTLTLFLFVGLILKMYCRIPDKPINDIVYIYVGVPVLIYLLTIIFEILVSLKQKKVLQVFMADPNWGPDNSLLKKSRHIFESGTVTTEFMYRQELYRKPLMKPPDFSDQNIVQLI